MALDPITAILNIGNTVLDRVLPDKTANDAAKAQLLTMQLKGEIDSQIGQIQVDQVEAASQSVFVAGWRPLCGWVCGCALAYSYIIQPFLVCILVAFKVNFDQSKLPQLNMVELIGLLSTMMGMGVMRSVDKAMGNGNGH